MSATSAREKTFSESLMDSQLCFSSINMWRFNDSLKAAAPEDEETLNSGLKPPWGWIPLQRSNRLHSAQTASYTMVQDLA